MIPFKIYFVLYKKKPVSSLLVIMTNYHNMDMCHHIYPIGYVNNYYFTQKDIVLHQN